MGERDLRHAAAAGEDVQVVEGGCPQRDQNLTGARLGGRRLLVAQHLGAAVLVEPNRLHVATCYSTTQRSRRPEAEGSRAFGRNAQGPHAARASTRGHVLTSECAAGGWT